MSSFERKQADELAQVDDWSSAWEECKALGLKWGGRGRGGRAAGRQTVQTRDVVVEGCTLSYLGSNLLERTTLRLLCGRRYGLIGRNGVGKSTLMRRISTGTLPGFPTHLSVAQVYQDLPTFENPELNAVEYLVRCDPAKAAIELEISRLEGMDCTEADLERHATMLSDLYDAIEDDGTATARAIKILKNLGFSEKRRLSRVSELSGGWKMRCALALALFQEPDLLLLDEPTNHLDIEGVEWLKSYLLGPAQGSGMTVLITSHDRGFLDDICTDIILFRKLHLHYYPGNYTDFINAKKDKDLHLVRNQELIDKQRKHVEETIQRMQVQAAKSDGKTGMVASRKKKLDRIGCEKNAHGHRFRAQQDSYEGISSGIREGSINETALGRKTGESRSIVDGPDKEDRMQLPSPPPLGVFGPLYSLRSVFAGYPEQFTETPEIDTAPSSKMAPKALSTKGKGTSFGERKACVTSEENDFNCPSDLKIVLKNISLDIEQNSKIAILGKNGCGKSTLLHLLVEAHAGTSSDRMASVGSLVVTAGEVSRMPGFRVAYYQQSLQEKLPFEVSALEYITSVSPAGTTEQIVRAQLGSFGLSGDIVLRKIGTLSGGQKSRIVLAQLTLNRPNLLILDEPTNNLDLDAVRALGEALKNYDGAFILACHDSAFVSETSEVIYQLFQGKLTRLEGGVSEYKSIIANAVERQKRSLLGT